MSITTMEKELTAVAISVAAGCKPCTQFHVNAARRAGALDDEIEQAIADAIAVREDATRLIENYALGRLDEITSNDEPAHSEEFERMEALVSLGAAFAINCTTSLEVFLGIAETLDITQQDVGRIIELAALIKRKAASHVERLAGIEDAAA